MHNRSRLQVAVLSFLTVAWVLVMLLTANPLSSGFWGFLCFMWVPAACLLSLVLNVGMPFRPGLEDAPVVAVPYYQTGIYLLVTVLLNAVCLYVGKPSIAVWFVAANVLCTALYMLLMTAFMRFLSHHNTRLGRAARSVTMVQGSQKQLEALLIAATDDRQAYDEIYRLKEEIEASGNVLAQRSEEYRAAFTAAVATITELMEKKADISEIRRAVSEARKIHRSAGI